MKISYSIEEIIVGMEVSYSQTITDSDIKQFAGISKDFNPIHMSDEYASKTRYKKRVAHGFLSACLFSGIFGTKFPGEGCLYVSQSIKFKLPVYINDTVKVTVTVKSVDIERRRVFFKTTCYVKNKIVIDGEAEIVIPIQKP